MKIFLATLSLCFSFSISFLVNSYAKDLLSVDSVIKQGHPVLMGELTGAGSKLSINALHGFVLSKGVLLKSECSEIIVKNSNDPKVSDIVKIKVGETLISSEEIEGIVTK